MKAVILAAGMGTRMSYLTTNEPKCILKVGGEPILKRMINQLSKNGIKKIVIVVGYKEEKIREKVFEWNLDSNIQIISNNDYHNTNNIYSLWLAKDELCGKDFVLLDGDLICEDSIINEFVSQQKKNCIAVDNTKFLGEEEMKVLVNAGKLEKISKKINPQHANGEYLGLAKFSKEGSRFLLGEIKKYIDNNQFNSFCDEAFNQVIEKTEIHIHNIKPNHWIEIDTVEDYEKANKLLG